MCVKGGHGQATGHLGVLCYEGAPPRNAPSPLQLQPRPAPAPADKRRRVSSPDYEQVAKQWAAMKVLLESLGCWQGDAPPSLQGAQRKELITPAQHKVYTELHQDMNRVRH